MTKRARQLDLDDRMRRLEDGEDSSLYFEPVVKSQCICPNQGQPDANGFIVTSPSCLFPGHGLKARHIPKAEIDVESIGRTIQFNRGTLGK